MEVFEALASRIDEAWRAVGYEELAFSALARDLLERAALHRCLSARDIAQWVAGGAELPAQRNIDSDFGQPPLTIASRERFYVEVLFWFDGTTEIHEHAFNGAFVVLEGSSIHSPCTFEVADDVDTRVKLVVSTPQPSELLGPGDCREIDPRAGRAHSLFHLGRPSVTVVARTPGRAAWLPQLAVLRPAVAYDPRAKSPALTRRLQLLSVLLEADADGYRESASTLIARTDLYTALMVVVQAAEAKPADARHLVERMCERFGERFRVMTDVVGELRRERNVIARREVVTAPEHRFLLALLLNVRDRETLLRFVAEQRPGRDPVDVVLSWLRELSRMPTANPARYGVSALGISLDEGALQYLEAVLRERPLADTASSARHALTLPRTSILRPLFSRGAR